MVGIWGSWPCDVDTAQKQGVVIGRGESVDRKEGRAVMGRLKYETTSYVAPSRDLAEPASALTDMTDMMSTDLICNEKGAVRVGG
jgi:hypothetical protein